MNDITTPSSAITSIPFHFRKRNLILILSPENLLFFTEYDETFVIDGFINSFSSEDNLMLPRYSMYPKAKNDIQYFMLD